MMMQSPTVNQDLFLRLAENKLESIASRRVGHHPDRVDPRAWHALPIAGTASRGLADSYQPTADHSGV
ncbi:MAG: hypothetical protein ACODAD_09420 [Planctomycetota bacterium]